MKNIVVTGVSTGIGYAVAKYFTQQGARVFGSVRNTDDAERLQSELGKLFTALIFDITNESEVSKAAKIVKKALNGNTLSCLINNAGIIVPAPLIVQPVEDFRHQIEVNLIGTLIVTQAFAPLLGIEPGLNGKPGKIINISSVNGKFALPFVGAYSSSKHALEGFSDTLRRELKMYGIDVIVVGPGPVDTAMCDKGVQIDNSRLIDTDYYNASIKAKEYVTKQTKNALSAQKIAILIFNIFNSNKPKTRYAPAPNKIGQLLLEKFLPKRWVDFAISKALGLKLNY